MNVQADSNNLKLNKNYQGVNKSHLSHVSYEESYNTMVLAIWKRCASVSQLRRLNGTKKET